MLWLGFVVGLLGLVNAQAGCENNVYSGADFVSDLPLVIIRSPTPLPAAGEEGVAAYLDIINNPNKQNRVTDRSTDYAGYIKTHRRGSSSDELFCKKQYTVKTRDVDMLPIKAEVFGLPPNDDWILYGPYTDKSLQRDVLVFQLSRDVGLYAPRTQFVEAFIVEDDSAEPTLAHYRGVYVWKEQVTSGKDRVPLKTLHADGRETGAQLSGGYLFKRDKRDIGDATFVTDTCGVPFVMSVPDEDLIQPPMLDWIGSYVSCFETSLFGAGWLDPTSGYRSFINASSFVNYFIIQEITNNADSYKYSTYMSKDRYGLIHMGPVWDFNLGFGNIEASLDAAAKLTTGWKYEVNARLGVPDISAWYARMFADPTFVQELQTRWAEVRLTVLSDAAVGARVDANAATIALAQVRNFQKWNSPGIGEYIWPEPMPQPTTFQGHTDALRNWLLSRLQWIDTAITEPLFVIDTPTHPYSCCPDPQFRQCPAPSGEICPLPPADAQAGLGMIFDTECRHPDNAGCTEGLKTDQGACRFCRTDTWNGQAGLAEWPACNGCSKKTCKPFDNTDPETPTSAPTPPTPPTIFTSVAPTSKPPPTSAPTPKPTYAPGEPTPPPTFAPTMMPTDPTAPSVPTTKPPTNPGAIDAPQYCQVFLLMELSAIGDEGAQGLFMLDLGRELAHAVGVPSERIIVTGLQGPGVIASVKITAALSTEEMYAKDVKAELLRQVRDTTKQSAVYQEPRGKYIDPREGKTDPPVEPKGNAGVIAAVAVIGVVLIAGVTAVIFWRKNKMRREPLLSADYAIQGN